MIDSERPILVNNILRGRSRRPDKIAERSRVGFLNVVSKAERDGYWTTECSHCTAKTLMEYSTEDLLSARVSTCGCKKTTKGDFAEYAVWKQARNRCRNPKNRDYVDYGGRGIVFDAAWDDFGQFFGDVGPRYREHFQLERLNNDGNYTAENCVWVPPVQQAATRRKP